MAAFAAGCGGGERQDEGAPEGTFDVDVTEASFPAEQSIAAPAVLSLEVANDGDRAVPDLAVTVETLTSVDGEAPAAFGQRTGDTALADSDRPVWIVDEPPAGGESAYTNTWTVGELGPGERKTIEWKVTPMRPGDYTVTYRLSPSVVGDAGIEGEDTAGEFEVSISDEPVAAKVNGKGEVVRGED
ncbi:MAG: hypothetical protein ABW060_01155 [Solirubrobacteraceae bacterium]